MFTGCFPLTCCSFGVYLHRQIITLIPSKKQNVFYFSESFKEAWGRSSWQCESRRSSGPLSVLLFTICSHRVHYSSVWDNSLCSGTARNERWWTLLPTPETPCESEQKMASPPRLLLCWDGTHAWTLSVGWSWQKDGLGWHMGSTMTNLVRELVPYVEYPYCCKTCKEKAVKTSDLILLQD